MKMRLGLWTLTVTVLREPLAGALPERVEAEKASRLFQDLYSAVPVDDAELARAKTARAPAATLLEL